jgi:hypothetical protein
VTENRVLNRIFGAKRDEVTEGWRKLYNEELNKFYSSLSIIRMIKSRRMSWAGHVVGMGAKWNEYRISVGKPQRKRPLRRPRCWWVVNVKIEIGWDGMDWIDLAQDRDQWRALVNTIMDLRVTQNVGKFLSICITGGFSRRAQLHAIS